MLLGSLWVELLGCLHEQTASQRRTNCYLTTKCSPWGQPGSPMIAGQALDVCIKVLAGTPGQAVPCRCWCGGLEEHMLCADRPPSLLPRGMQVCICICFCHHVEVHLQELQEQLQLQLSNQGQSTPRASTAGGGMASSSNGLLPGAPLQQSAGPASAGATANGTVTKVGAAGALSGCGVAACPPNP
jgi:hypothetical protein